MTDQDPVRLTTGPPETVLEPAPEAARSALAEALDAPADARRNAVAGVVARWPAYLEGWARLGDLGRDPVERYACYRVGYHRGLDQLRQSGWRGTGYVRWRNESNRGFLRALAGLANAAAAIDERDEHERCSAFLRQLDPDWPPDEPGLQT